MTSIALLLCSIAGADLYYDNKPDALVLFSSNSCEPCRLVEPAIRSLYAEGWPAYIVKYETNRDWFSRYSVRLTPTCIIIRSGQEVARAEGTIGKASLQRMMERWGLPRRLQEATSDGKPQASQSSGPDSYFGTPVKPPKRGNYQGMRVEPKGVYGMLVPAGGFGEGVTLVAGNKELKLQASPALYGDDLPALDRKAFQVTLFMGANEESTLLARDWLRNPRLHALASDEGWANFSTVPYEGEASQAMRDSWGVKSLPCVCLFSSPDQSSLPSEIVYTRSGYGGDPDELANDMLSALRKFYEAYAPDRVPAEQCPGPGPCPTPSPRDNPVLPSPNIDIPDLPDLWPPDDKIPDEDDVVVETSWNWGAIAASIVGGLCCLASFVLMLGSAAAGLYVLLKKRASNGSPASASATAASAAARTAAKSKSA